MKSKVSSPKVFNIVLCVLILLVFVLTIGVKTNAEVLTESSYEVIPLSKQLGTMYPELKAEITTEVTTPSEPEIIIEVILDLDYYIKEYEQTIIFFSKLFNYSFEDIINDLQTRKLENQSFEPTNIGYLKDENGSLNIYSSLKYGLIEYFYDLNDLNSELRNTSFIPYRGDAEYVENLIMYYSSIYTNVDAVTLLSIGAAESGYYKVSFMLEYNNVYGGMSSRGLIKHNNIEQGVLSYVRMMSRNYYGKGLDTIHKIGRVYCPVYENELKVASPHWINLVTKANTKYSEYNNTVAMSDLNNIEKAV